MIDTDNSCRRCNPTCPENCEDCEKEEICGECEHSSIDDEGDILVCCQSPAPLPTGVSVEEVQQAGIDIDQFYFATIDLKKCPMGKW